MQSPNTRYQGIGFGTAHQQSHTAAASFIHVWLRGQWYLSPRKTRDLPPLPSVNDDIFDATALSRPVTHAHRTIVVSCQINFYREEAT